MEKNGDLEVLLSLRLLKFRIEDFIKFHKLFKGVTLGYKNFHVNAQ